MEAIVGSSLRSKSETVQTDIHCTTPKYIGLYFGAHWAPPCRLFTTSLSTFYTEINASSKQLEVIFVSIDGNQDAFERNYAEMPWLAIPYTDEARISSLKQRYGINGIPTLVILDPQGSLVTYEGRKDIMKDTAQCIKEWDADKAREQQN